MTLITKECKKHGMTVFYKRTDSSGYICKKCNSENTVLKRKKYILKAIEYKGGCCLFCGYKKCVAALEFHHLNPETKEFGISNSGNIKSWEKMKVELDKCILLCSNCHKELHYTLKLNSKKEPNQ